ncbi:unnamed protein product [Pedinophyceae sp. YPF-701]|nr:unnamed protein product [Pedinophyceae sp. YPF-701]
MAKAGMCATGSRPAARAAVAQARPRVVAARATTGGGVSFLQKLGRTLKEKAEADIGRLSGGMEKTRTKLSVVDELFQYWNLEDAEDQLEELEDILISADFGPKTALKVVDAIREDVLEGRLRDGKEVQRELKKAIVDVLNVGGDSALNLAGEPSPAVLFIVGVNGGGKTTTIGKLSHKLQSNGVSCMLAPGDTFRAAAAEQLAEWGRRSGADMSDFEEGAKPSGVLYKAVEQARKQGKDVLICDTSGRLHTNVNLMKELQGCKVGVEKALGRAPDEVLLVLDGTTGLNMVNQAKEFNEAVGLTGLILTKLDGTARGGAVVSVIDQLKVPVKFVGVGEGLEDLQPFVPENFVDALFPKI